MQNVGPRHLNPKLQEVLAEASLALAGLDADRLEELALSCQALNQDGTTVVKSGAQLARQVEKEMAVFGRVLEATRANLEVVNRVRELREGRLEYCGGTGVIASGRGIGM